MPNGMPAAEVRADSIRNELERILSSAGFARNERLSRFLRFVVEEQLAGRGGEIKESLIAVEVFGRKPNYNPRQDPVVRIEAGKLRARLAEYYASEGGADAWIIDLPKGGYGPVFRARGPANHRAGRRSRIWPALLVGAMAIAVAIGGWWLPHKRGPITIAVLPLENLSHSPNDDYLADGLTDEVIRNLSAIEGLEVRSRTSSFAMKGKPHNVREAARQLGADYIVEGSTLRNGRQLRVNAQLVRAQDDAPVWSGKFEREMADVFAIQDEISLGIVNNLRLKLGGRRRYETSVEAYDLYLRARAEEIQRGSQGLKQSVGLFEEVIRKDPSFAPAYAGLAVAHAARSGQITLDMAGEMAKMREAAEKAVQFDPLSAEAHDALGMSYARDGQWDRSEKRFRRAIELEPSRSLTYGHFAMDLLLPLGRIQEALQYLRRAEQVDPLSPQVHNLLAYALLSAGQYDQADSQCQKLPLDYPYRGECLGRARLRQGKTDEAIQIMTTAVNQGVPEGATIWGYLGHAHARAGHREVAEQIAKAQAQHPFQQALIFAGLGDKDRTLEAAERMAVQGPVRVGRDVNLPEFALIRGDSRLKALRKKVGLPE